ncbi:MAG: SPASM domain-containing protein [Bacteroidales bacterium]|nr:MAG: SPASM domain-containing protein [Bacteroidales bacterium]
MLCYYLTLLLTSSFKRVFNLIKLRFSYHLSGILKSPVLWGYPSRISIEPTTFCNLTCPECPSGQRTLTRPAGNMQYALYTKIIHESSSFLAYLNLYFQGEPFLHPEIFKMITLAGQKRIYTAVSTNGHFLDAQNSKQIIDSGLDRLIICMDGINQKEYEIYRKNGNFNKIIEGIKTLVRYKNELKSRKPFLTVQALIMQHNQSKIKEMKRYFLDLGVNQVLFKSIQINEFSKGSPLIPTISKYSRYKSVEKGKYINKNPLANKCWRMWSSAVITQDGIVIPCCFDKNASYKLGNINDSGLKDIWKSNSYDKFRKSVLTCRKDIDICRNCTEGLKKIFFKK